MKSSRCCQSSGAVLLGFWWFWLGSLLAIPSHQWRWQRIQLCYNRSRCTRSEQSDLQIVPVSTLLLGTDQCGFQSSRPEPQRCGHSLFSFYLWSIITVCLHWINVLFEVGIVHWLCLSAYSTMDFESHSILYLYLKNACKLESHRGGPTVFKKLLRMLQNMLITQQHFVGIEAILNRFVLFQIQTMWSSKGHVSCIKSVTSRSDHFLIKFYKITDTYWFKYNTWAY